MGVPTNASMNELNTASEPVKEAHQSKLSTNSLIVEGERDDSMIAPFVVDEDSKVIGIVEKENVKTKVGISLRKSEEAQCVIIAKIREGGAVFGHRPQGGTKSSEHQRS